MIFGPVVCVPGAGTHTTCPNTTLPNIDYTHKTSQVISVKHVQYSLRMDKTSQVISVKHVQYSLRMDPKGSETCRTF